jgi:hypothetical protein
MNNVQLIIYPSGQLINLQIYKNKNKMKMLNKWQLGDKRETKWTKIQKRKRGKEWTQIQVEHSWEDKQRMEEALS